MKKHNLRSVASYLVVIVALLCAQIVTNLHVLAVAPTGVGSQSSTTTLASLQTVKQSTTLSQIQTSVQTFLDQYGLTLSFSCPAPSTQNGHSCTPTTDSNFGAVKVYSAMFIEEMSKYPTGITLNQGFAVNTLYLVNSVQIAGPNGFAGSVAGVYFDGYGVIYGTGYNSSDNYRKTIHHEFMHYLDFQTRSTAKALNQTTWTNLNPNGFTYSNYGSNCYEGSTGCSTGNQNAGFVSNYATQAYVEDVAETESYLFSERGNQILDPLLQTDAALTSKVALIKGFLAGLDPSIDDTYIQTLHTFGQQYDGELDTFFGYKTISNTGQVTTIPDTADFTGLFWGMGIKGGTDMLIVDGKIGNVVVEGGTLEGTGTVGTLQVFDTGILAPGHSPGCLSSGNLTLNGEFKVEIGGIVPCSGYDQSQVTGSVDVTGATLTPSLYGGFVPSVGQSYTIILNDTNSDPVTGTFANTTGNTITASGVTYSVSYAGGDGNEVVLTVTGVDPAIAQAASNATIPKTPNTGLRLLYANPIASLVMTILISLSLLFISRKVKSTPRLF